MMSETLRAVGIKKMARLIRAVCNNDLTSIEYRTRMDAVLEEYKLGIIDDRTELARIVTDVISAHPKALTDFRAGKRQALGFLMGRVMQTTKARANPEVTRKLLVEQLTEEMRT